MATPVPQAPSSFALQGVRTGRPVVTGGLSRLADDLAHVNGHLLHKAGEAQILPRPAGRTSLQGLAHTVYVPWSRSPGAKVVRVVVELRPGNEVDESQIVTTALPTGAAWLDAAGLDGSVTLYNPSLGRTAPREIVGWVDVTGCTVGALADVFAFACAPSTKGEGIQRAAVHEAPVAALAIDAAEPGWDKAAITAGRLVIDGGASSPRGMQRLPYLLDQGRAGFRQHFHLGDLETADVTAFGTTPHWSRMANVLGPLDWLLTSTTGAADPVWFVVVRSLYGALGDTATFEFFVRYRTSNATACSIKGTFTSGDIVAGAFVPTTALTTTLVLPGTSGAWAWATTPATLPVDGAGGLVQIALEAKGPGAGQLLVFADIDLTENEP